MREVRLQGNNYDLVLDYDRNFWVVLASWLSGFQRTGNKDKLYRPISGKAKGKVGRYNVNFTLNGFGKRTKLISGGGVTGHIQKSDKKFIYGGLVRGCDYEEVGRFLTRYRMVLSDGLAASVCSDEADYMKEIKFATQFNPAEEDIKEVVTNWVEYEQGNSQCASPDIGKVVEGCVDFMTIALAVFNADIGNMDRAKQFLKRYEHQPV